MLDVNNSTKKAAKSDGAECLTFTEIFASFHALLTNLKAVYKAIFTLNVSTG